ncbi:MAG: D-2-hydroxyacid dehydrogenase [Thermoguttaceae bacterium]
MQIVVLDGYALNPGDLSWAPLEAIGPCVVHDRTAPAEIVRRAAEAEIVLTNKTVLSRETIAQLPRLRYIGVLATGYNIVDVAAARERGIVVTNVPDYATPSVVQMVFAHLLNLTLHVADHGRGVAAGRWTACPDFAYWDFPLIELAGLTLGIVGFGRIGRAVAKVAVALGMTVLAYGVRRPAAIPSGVRFTGLDELFCESDVVSLHCPLTPETHHLVSAERLARMKPGAMLINTGRGPLVDEAALADALNSGRLAGAGLDVLSTEPPPADNPLLHAKNCCLTPHIGWATAAARKRLVDCVVANVRDFLAGSPQNVVS